MQNRIDLKFAEIKAKAATALIPFIVAGDPDLQTTLELVLEFSRQNAVVIELGVPFSDPVADGITIQAASERALKNDVSLDDAFEIVRQARHKGCKTPIILFSYFNPILQFGLENFAEKAIETGVDGILVTDLICDEADEFYNILCGKNLHLIMLAAPTSSDERLSRICGKSGGFIYAISRAGVTGAKTDLSFKAENLVERIRKFTDLPVAVGFGITNFEQVKEVCAYADAAVVGSAIVKEIENSLEAKDTILKVRNLVEKLRGEN